MPPSQWRQTHDIACHVRRVWEECTWEISISLRAVTEVRPCVTIKSVLARTKSGKNVFP